MSDSDRYLPTQVKPCTDEEAQARRDAHASRWTGIPAATLRGLRDGSLVAVPTGIVRALHGADGAREWMGSIIHDALAAAQEPPR